MARLDRGDAVTTAAVVVYTLLSVAIVVFHLSAWLAAGAAEGGLGSAEGFFARIGWGSTTYLLGLAWVALCLFASWRVVRSARPRPVAALTILAIVVMTPMILGVMANVPYKGASATDFLDGFLQPGGITPGGNGTMQHVLMSAAAAGVAAVQIAHATGRSRGVRS